MKTILPLFVHRARTSRRGIALISVLAMVVLLTALIVAFMLRAGAERQASAFYKTESGARALADTSINLVQAQINEATGKGVTFAWASQPGAIRTYDNSGNLSMIYRLYSAPSLTTTTASDLNNDLPPSTWATQTAAWVDLNAPVNVDPNPSPTTGGNPIYTHFPILDPRDPTDPTLQGTVKMDGFSLSPSTPTNLASSTSIDSNIKYNPAPMPVRWLYVLQDGSVISPDASGNGIQLTFTSATKPPGISNPIVGRIAFWTDDETCKVNINTAAGDGAIVSGDPTAVANAEFWSTPYFSSVSDVNMAVYQPYQGEFQRYPGHPGTVAFSNILSSLGNSIIGTVNTGGVGSPGSLYNVFTSGALTSEGITPRYTWNNTLYSQTSGDVGPTSGDSITVATNRLYPSVAELLFQSTRSPSAFNSGTDVRQKTETARFFLTAHSRAPELNLYGLPRVAIWPISDNSGVAPPGTGTQNSISAVDRLIAFDSAIGAKPYYFSRTTGGVTTSTGSGTTGGSGMTNPELDVNLTRNKQLLGYLDTLTQTSIPGYGGTFGGSGGKYGSWGMRQILTEIFDYVRMTDIEDSNYITLTATNGVRTNSTPPTVYAAPWEDPNGYCEGWGEVIPSYYATWGTTGLGTLPVLTEATIHFVALGDDLNPIPKAEWSGGVTEPTNYQTTGGGDPGIIGLGVPYDKTNITTNPTTGVGTVAAGYVAVQAFFYLQWALPTQWQYNQSLLLNFDLAGLNTFSVGGATVATTNTSLAALTPTQIATGSLGMISDAQMNMGWAASQGAAGIAQSVGYYPAYGMVGSETTTSLLKPTTLMGGIFPFYSTVFTIKKLASPSLLNTMTFSGGNITVKLYNGAAGATVPGTTSHDLFATYQIPFASGSFPVPTVTSDSYRIIGTQNWAGGEPWGFGGGSNPAVDERWFAAQDTNGCASIFFASGDVAQSMVLSTAYSDARTLMGLNHTNMVSTSSTPVVYVPHPNYGVANHFAHDLVVSGAYLIQGGTSARLVAGVPGQGSVGGYEVTPFASPVLNNANSITGLAGAFTNKGAPGDWTNGVGWWPDGPWYGKADEGSLPGASGYTNYTPYFTVGNGTYSNWQTLFSPNKEIPSPGMFGSLPTGVPQLNAAGTVQNGNNPEPWQTLLFRPGPGLAGLSSHHPGEAGYQRDGTTLAGAPPDHVLLDLFWMPIAEPYAISEPFSTAGKINLNYQIVPFTYINRSTALRAALAGEKVAIGPVSDAAHYKSATGLGAGSNVTNTQRVAINLDETTKQFDTKFGTGASISGGTVQDIFHSASQICDIFLVPKDAAGTYTASTFPAAWYDLSSSSAFALIGDNVRERPYVDIYQKVTTKSNTYSVYYRVQTLKSPSTVAPNTWDDSQCQVTGEYRGSTTLERFIDPNETISGGTTTAFTTDYGSMTSAPTSNMEPYYQWRIVENRQFTP